MTDHSLFEINARKWQTDFLRHSRAPSQAETWKLAEQDVVSSCAVWRKYPRPAVEYNGFRHFPSNGGVVNIQHPLPPPIPRLKAISFLKLNPPLHEWDLTG